MPGMKNIAKTAAAVMLVNLLSKLVSLVRETAVAAGFGAGAASDAYYMAQTMPVLIFSAVAAALSTTLIPLYTECLAKSGPRAASRYLNNVLNVALAVSALLCLAGIIFSPRLLRLIAPGFAGEQLALTVLLSYIMLPMILGQTVAAVFTGYLQANREFCAPALVGVVSNCFIILSAFFAGRYGIRALATGTLAGFGLQAAVMLPPLLRSGYRWQPVFNLNDVYLRKMFSLIGPVLVGSAVLQLSNVVTRAAASALQPGSVAALSYANRLNLFAYTTVSLPLATVMYPLLSQLAVAGDVRGLREAVASALNLVTLLMVPATVALMVLRVPVVTVLFRRGAFDAAAVRMTAVTLLYYTAGLTAFGFRDIISRTFYALQDTQTPVINSVLTLAVNIAGVTLLSRRFGLGGIALSVSVAALFGGVLFVRRLRRRIGSGSGRKLLVCFAKVSFASLAMGAVLRRLLRPLSSVFETGPLPAQIGALALCVGAGLAVYIGLVLLLRVEEARMVLELVRRERADAPAEPG